MIRKLCPCCRDSFPVASFVYQGRLLRFCAICRDRYDYNTMQRRAAANWREAKTDMSVLGKVER